MTLALAVYGWIGIAILVFVFVGPPIIGKILHR